MKTSVSADGHILIPAELRQQDDLQPGQEIEIERIRCGEYRVSRIPTQRNVGLVDWLLACPEKGYFVPIELAPHEFGHSGNRESPTNE